jgi:hypothetical protein
MNPIKGPKMRCNIPQFLEIYDAQEYSPTINHLKNYPRNSICQSQVKDIILSKTRIHISLTNDDEIENEVISYVNDKWNDESAGHLNDFVSQSIMNSIFNNPQKVGSVWARYFLKRMWEGCCAKAERN